MFSIGLGPEVISVGADWNMTSDPRSLMTELDETLSAASDERQRTILRKVTELFLHRSKDYSGDQVALFDDVIFRLIERSEHSALLELSSKLAPVDNAPINVVVKLSQQDDIAISGPILRIVAGGAGRYAGAKSPRPKASSISPPSPAGRESMKR